MDPYFALLGYSAAAGFAPLALTLAHHLLDIRKVTWRLLPDLRELHCTRKNAGLAGHGSSGVNVPYYGYPWAVPGTVTFAPTTLNAQLELDAAKPKNLLV
jgi:hypothetical protein